MAEPFGQYHRLRPVQIEAIKRLHPIAIIPWGAIEWHSYHNPVGLDGLIAESLALALAKQTGGLVLPPVYVGTDTIKVAHGFPHSIEHSQALVKDLCVEYCEQLSAEGFQVIVIITGHCGAGHRTALEEACEKVADLDAQVLLIPAFDPVSDRYPVNHAAKGETSLQMHTHPGLVDTSLLPNDRTPTLEHDGVWGDDPSTSTAERGGDILDLFVDRCAPMVRDKLKPAT